MKIVFFKRPKPKKFHYKPRYWDPEHEEFEKRKRELDGAGKDERTTEEVKEDLKKQMDTRWRRKHDPEAVGRSNPWMKIFIYVLIIFLGIYFIFFTGFINNFVRFFTA
jgi:hypothetical protein